MNSGHRRCKSILMRQQNDGDWVCVVGCAWPSGHPDRHWSLIGGVVHRWANDGRLYVKETE